MGMTVLHRYNEKPLENWYLFQIIPLFCFPSKIQAIKIEKEAENDYNLLTQSVLY